MWPAFQPIVRNSHLLTIAGNFWPRRIDEYHFPPSRVVYAVDSKNSVVALEHQPDCCSRGQVILLHGLEGSASAGYITSLSQALLAHGLGVHRLNMRTCGGTENLCETMYHSGLTEDTHFVIDRLLVRFAEPLFVVGFSLGGNVALKLAGELGGSRKVAGVVAISTPIDLAASVRCLDKKSNFLYSRRFLDRLRERIRRKSRTSPAVYSVEGLETVKTIWEFDDRFTAPLFGFGTAANYYRTQSALRFLDRIKTPTLVIAAKDDPLVPFDSYQHPAFKTNPALVLLAPQFGGHLGFLSRRKPRFWIDGVVLAWFERLLASGPFPGTKAEQITSA